MLRFRIIHPSSTDILTNVHRITLAIVINLLALPLAAALAENGCHDSRQDRIWLVSSRALDDDVCRANLDRPAFQVCRIDHCQSAGATHRVSLDEFLDGRGEGQPLLFQVHGNRMTAQTALERGLFVYHQTAPEIGPQPIDFVIYSWPSDRDGILANDARAKAARTDVEGLYLAWLLRELFHREQSVAIIGFSFGGRVATGSLHALAGGALGGRRLPGEHLTGAGVGLGLIAPALEDRWLRAGYYHGLASQNIRTMTVLYNERDAVLRRYWLLDSIRGSVALGYTGPKGIAPGFNGAPIPVRSCDCSTTLGIRHDEKKYYLEECRAGKQMAQLVQYSRSISGSAAVR